MNTAPLPASSTPVLRVSLAIALVTALAYANSFSAPYLFDDAGAVIDNPTIRHLGAVGTVLSPLTNGTPVSGRPLVNLTFALNYATSGEAIWSYHAVNLLIHLLATVTLFGLVRRTLLLPQIAPQLRSSAVAIAGAVAALWAVHPLQTEAVTYVSQRAEALMGLCYLLTLYCFIRGVGEKRRGWLTCSVLACLAGMGSKEVMISAPLLVLLYDRTFLVRSFQEALRTRPWFYIALGATWTLLAYEMISVGNRGGAVGTGLKITAWQYALTQCHAIVLYLRLAVWPHPLIFDYGTTLAGGLRNVWPEALLLLALVAATLFLIWKRSPFGFIGAWFFAILAPTSSVVPLAKQTIAEHRMYLPLAAILLLVVLGLNLALGRVNLAVTGLLLLACLELTLHRNGEYLDGITIWTQSIAHYPGNPRAHTNLGNAYVETGRPALGEAEYRAAILLDPGLPEAHNNLGVVEAAQGRREQAKAEYETTMRLAPGWDKPRRNLEELEGASPSRGK